MSSASLIILICIAVAWFTYRRIKQFPVFAVNRAMKNKEYTHAIELLQGEGAKKLLEPLERDRRLMKAYFMKGDKEAFLKQISLIASTPYKKGSPCKVLEIWLHHCLRCHTREFSDAVLSALKTCADKETIELADIAYRVLLYKDTSDLPVIEQRITQTHRIDFHYGLLHYLRGKIFLYTQRQEDALRSFDNALFGFDAAEFSIYQNEVKAYIDTNGDRSLLHYGSMTTSIEEPIHMSERYRYDYGKKSKQKH